MSSSKRKRKSPMEASDSDTSEALKEGANGGEDDVEEREDEEMEKELEKLEEKLNNLRRTLPERFVAALSSSMLVQRSVLPLESLGFGRKNDESSSNGGTGAILKVDQEILDKLNLIKTKPCNALEKLPKVLERVNACIERMEYVQRLGTKNIHPIFKKNHKLT